MTPLLRALLFALVAAASAAALAQELKPWKGGATPPLALSGLDGRAHRLDAYRGNVVIVNFWATWCEPCRDEMPSMRLLKESLAGMPFEVLAVNLGEPETRIRSFLEKVPVNFPVLLDSDSSASKAWRARLLPATFIVGPNGAIRYSHLGELDWSHASVRQAIVALLKPQTPAPTRLP
jgi:thiol-disulfide isomerase/thioredoxin